MRKAALASFASMRLAAGASRLAAPRGAAAHVRPLCAAASSGLHAALERHNIPPSAVPDGADAQAVLRQLRLLETLGVPDMARTVERDPSVLTHDTKVLANSHLEYLLSLGIPRIGPIIEAAPQLLSCDLTHDLHRKVTILQAIGVVKIGPWLYKNRGRLVSMDVELDMRPPIEFLQSLPRCEVHRVVQALPERFFGRTRRAKWEERVAYLTDVVGIDREKVGRMISKNPPVLTMNIDNMITPKVEWLTSLGVSDVPTMLATCPFLLSLRLETLQSKHAFITQQWGRPLGQIESFPQALTYSLHYLRARAGFLLLKEREAPSVYRALRYADAPFARQLCKAKTDEYQAFARAVKRGGGQSEYSAHDEYEAHAPGGGGGAYDWGETPLDEMVEQIGSVRLASRGVLDPELSAVDKYVKWNDEMLARDAAIERQISKARAAIHAVASEPAAAVGEAEVSPVPGASAGEPK